MALFEYDCPKCGNEFEKIVRPTQKQEVTCPKCGSAKVKRRMSRIASSRATGTSSGGSDGGASCSSGFG
jgi:putative FmdB family regulatory protein